MGPTNFKNKSVGISIGRFVWNMNANEEPVIFEGQTESDLNVARYWLFWSTPADKKSIVLHLKDSAEPDGKLLKEISLSKSSFTLVSRLLFQPSSSFILVSDCSTSESDRSFGNRESLGFG